MLYTQGNSPSSFTLIKRKYTYDTSDISEKQEATKLPFTLCYFTSCNVIN